MEPSSLFPKPLPCGLVACRPIFIIRDASKNVIGFWIKRLAVFNCPIADDDFELLECYGDPVLN